MIEILLVQSFFWITRWNLPYGHDRTTDISLPGCWLDYRNYDLVCYGWCLLCTKAKEILQTELQTLMYSLLDKNNFQIFLPKNVLMRGIHLSSVFCFIHLFVSQNNKHDMAPRKLILTLNIQFCNSQCQLFLTIKKIFELN